MLRRASCKYQVLAILIYRQPTLEEAVNWILKAQTSEYKNLQIAEWKREFGETFAKQVKAEVLARMVKI